MTFTNIHNPRKTLDGIILNVTTPSGDIIDFHAMPTDTDEYGRLLYTRALNGEFGVPKEYTPIEMTPEYRLSYIKSLAIAALAKSDITIIRCAENGVSVPTEWRQYRSELRSLVSASVWNDSLTLPTHPITYPAGS